MILINLDRLLSQLQTSGLQQKDQPLFQVISEIIKALRQIIKGINSEITEVTNIIPPPFIQGVGNTGIPGMDGLDGMDGMDGIGIQGPRGLTGATGASGNGISGPPGLDGIDGQDFEYFNMGNGSSGGSSSGSQWSVLTNGDVDFPELIFADGDVIMLETS